MVMSLLVNLADFVIFMASIYYENQGRLGS